MAASVDGELWRSSLGMMLPTVGVPFSVVAVVVSVYR